MLNVLKSRRFYQNALVLTGAVLLPAHLIKVSNEHVFPTTLEMANGMLVIVVVAAVVAMITASDERADSRCHNTALIGKLLLGLVLWWNLSGHWQLAREVDGAKSAVVEAEAERRALDELAEKDAQRQKELAKAKAEEYAAIAAAAKEEARNHDAAVRRFKKTGVRALAPAPPVIAPQLVAPQADTNAGSAASSAAVAIKPTEIKARVTPDEVRAAWNESLTKRAYIEAGVAIMLMVLLGILWHADFDRDGIADRIQRLPADIRAIFYPAEHAKIMARTAAAGEAPSLDARSGFSMEHFLQALQEAVKRGK